MYSVVSDGATNTLLLDSSSKCHLYPDDCDSGLCQTVLWFFLQISLHCVLESGFGLSLFLTHELGFEKRICGYYKTNS